MSRISIVHLNEKFFNEHVNHTEILKKPQRPHLVLILQVGPNTFAIPQKSNILHFNILQIRFSP